ncbi:hypothetical protein KKG41_01125 [Patescibacteria group bacterium]|nr:hypothetical protein [Patescibacteria group bacterium]
MRPGAGGVVGVDYGGVFRLDFDVPSDEIQGTNYTNEKIQLIIYRRSGGDWYEIADFTLGRHQDKTRYVRNLNYGQQLQIKYKVGSDEYWSYSYIELGYP